MSTNLVPQLIAQAMQAIGDRSLHDAENLSRQVLDINPNDPDGWHCLGLIATETGRHQLATELIQTAISLRPTEPWYHNNLGMVWRRMVSLEQAASAFQTALSLRHDYIPAMLNLAAVLCDLSRYDDAVDLCRRIERMKPNCPGLDALLGTAVQKLRAQRRQESSGRMVSASTPVV